MINCNLVYRTKILMKRSACCTVCLIVIIQMILSSCMLISTPIFKLQEGDLLKKNFEGSKP